MMHKDRPEFYLLIGKTPIAVDRWTWTRDVEQRYLAVQEGKPDPWRVERTEIGEIVVSTVFLGLDHNYSDHGDPLLFETIIFGGPLDGNTHRYTTWKQAKRGHDKIVDDHQEI